MCVHIRAHRDTHTLFIFSFNINYIRCNYSPWEVKILIEEAAILTLKLTVLKTLAKQRHNRKHLFSFCVRKAIVLQAQNQMSEAHKLLQKLLIHCQRTRNTEMVIR